MGAFLMGKVCELCGKKIKKWFVGDAEKGIKSAALSFIGRNPWVHKMCFKYTCSIIKKKKKKNTMEEMMLVDYLMMKKLGEIL